MVGLFRQSAGAKTNEAEAFAGRACEAIGAEYQFFSAGNAKKPDPANLDLEHVVSMALRDRPEIEGGIWSPSVGSVAYAYPTYEGATPKTDVPNAELTRIGDINKMTGQTERPYSHRYVGPTETLIIVGCPIKETSNTAWAMTRVHTTSGRSYIQLMLGLSSLLAMVVAAIVIAMRLVLTWSKHITTIERALSNNDLMELPQLDLTGERELDQIVLALNEAGTQLTVAKQDAVRQSEQIAQVEKLASIGRITAGIAHELRNPMAAMRLKIENTENRPDRMMGALQFVEEQITRLDRLLHRLLHLASPDVPEVRAVAIPEFLAAAIKVHEDAAQLKHIRFNQKSSIENASFDPAKMFGAIENLILNAIAATPQGGVIEVRAEKRGNNLVLTVVDSGPGPSPKVADRLFEPFVTDRPSGTGLGLPIVLEVARAHGGTSRLVRLEEHTIFEIEIPWLES
jgi:signal transduction histidine kinase